MWKSGQGMSPRARLWARHVSSGPALAKACLRWPASVQGMPPQAGFEPTTGTLSVGYLRKGTRRVNAPVEGAEGASHAYVVAFSGLQA